MKCNAQSGFSFTKVTTGHKPCPQKAEICPPVPRRTQIGNWSCGVTWPVMLTNHLKMSILIINLFCDLLSINQSFFTTTTTMAPSCITVFRPFNLRHHKEDLYERIQQNIYYGESRLRAAAAGIIRADVRHHGWMQTCLQQELV